MKYSLDDILTMLDGYTYYNHEEVMFIYYQANGDAENAFKYKIVCDENRKKLEAQKEKMKFEDEIKKEFDKLDEEDKLEEIA